MIIYMTVFFIAMFISIPIVFAMLGSSIYFVFISNVDLITVPQRMIVGLDSFLFLAIPFFIMLGSLMGSTGVMERLVRFADCLVGGIRGGLAHVDIVTSMIMGGIQGSALAESAAIGSLMIPSMIKNGYSPSFAAAVTSTASALGPIIPPSIIMVIYGSLGGVSVGRLFLGGFIPGVILGFFLMIFSYFICKRKGYGASKEQRSVAILLTSLKESIFALVIPVIIIGGIVGGVFTPTESGAIGVFYVLFMGLFGLGGIKLDFKAIVGGLRGTVEILGAVMFIVAAANIFGWVLNLVHAADGLSSLILSISTNRFIILLIINAILLVLGCFIEVAAILIVLTPLLVPFVASIGIDPIHFGLIFVINMMIGLNTPPVGLSMYIVCGIADISMGEWLKEAWPLLIAMVIVLLLICFIPGLTLFLPNLLMPVK